MNSTSTQDWIKTRIKPEEYKKYLVNDKDFIDEEEITRKLSDNKNIDKNKLRDILAKSLEISSLSTDETAYLLNVNDSDMLEEMEEMAIKIKKKVYDNRIVTFAPLYLGNNCINSCLYCGFRVENKKTKRQVLSTDEIKKEIEVLTGKIGHKRLIVVYGEHPSTDVNYMIESIKTIYGVKVATKYGHSEIRRVNVNAAPMQIDELKKLKQAGLGTYQVFQETYHHDTYRKLHPKQTVKGNYSWRLYTMHRAFEAGIDDVGIGALFGLYDWKFEVMGLVSHALELESRFGIGPHTISFPRLETAQNTPYVKKKFQNVTDRDFKKLITVLRLAVPYTGMILTARETAALRKEAFKLGVTQTDASSKIGIGAYSSKLSSQTGDKQQFYLADTRSLDELIRELALDGYITSFCTAGYRCGRTGSNIMQLLKTGTEGKYCKLNAVLTFREWLDDFASTQTKEIGEKLIVNEINEIKEKMPAMYSEFSKMYKRITRGERDIYI
ncbi:MAG: [FeFe] hydrogenase H-cluster radical SAM maturase HydG [Endomicrobiaceae bacterium]|nr:[FeFe] hydrogenase H-cluster radical SAM maturase HydG [Endomicrobiaceae bacterium]